MPAFCIAARHTPPASVSTHPASRGFDQTAVHTGLRATLFLFASAFAVTPTTSAASAKLTDTLRQAIAVPCSACSRAQNNIDSIFTQHIQASTPSLTNVRDITGLPVDRPASGGGRMIVNDQNRKHRHLNLRFYPSSAYAGSASLSSSIL